MIRINSSIKNLQYIGLLIKKMKYKKFVLKDFPNDNFPQDLSCFNFVEDAELDHIQLKEGQALIRVVWISSDPLLRTWISGAKSYLDPVKQGSPIPGFGVGRVVKLIKKKGVKNPLEVNDWCVGMLEWSQYMKIDIPLVQKLPFDNGQEMYKFLTIYGPTGFTSFWSIKREIVPFQIQNPKTKKPKTPEELNIVISSVAGGIGLTVAQYLSKLGYKKVYGIAGSDEKCRVAEKLGCKACINYKNFYDKDEIKAKDFENAVRQMMQGQNIDIYYENVGEDMLSSMLNLMANHSKVIMCGATATYNNWGKQQGIRNYQNIISRRIQMKGILYFSEDYNERIKVFMQMGALEMQGSDVLIKGIQKLPTTYRDMIAGKFIGKPVVQLWQQADVSFE